MPILANPLRMALIATALAAAELSLTVPGFGEGSSGTIALVPHRAVYDLKLAQTRGRKPMQAVRGRILYDFSGSACEGYALRFRQMSLVTALPSPLSSTDICRNRRA